jgi:AcrR family transcriptional regulator
MAPEQTRADLLRAASEAMIAKDSVDISLNDVGARTGLSAPLIQYHFGSKEGLLLALIERDAADAVGQLQILADLQIPADRKMRMHIEAFTKAYFRAPYLNRLLHSQMQSSGDDVASRVSEVFVKPIAEFQRALLEQGYAEGLFRRVDPMYFYFMIVGACEHMFARTAALRQVFGVPRITQDIQRGYAQEIIDTILPGISAKRPA